MRKIELSKRIAKNQPHFSTEDIDLAVDHIIAYLGTMLSKKGRIEIRGFGNFRLQYQAPHEARNPKTEEKVKVPGRYKVRFKMGKELKGRLNST